MSSTQFQEFEPSQQDLEQLYLSLEQPLHHNHALPVVRDENTFSGVRRVIHSTILGGYGIANVLAQHDLPEYDEIAVNVRTSPDDRSDPTWAEVIIQSMAESSRPERSMRYAIYRNLHFSEPGTFSYNIMKNLPSIDIDDFDLENFGDMEDESPEAIAAEEQLDFFEDQLRQVTPADIKLLGRLANELTQTIN